MFKTKMGTEFNCPATMVEAFREDPHQLYKGVVTYRGEEVPMEWVHVLLNHSWRHWKELLEYKLYVDAKADFNYVSVMKVTRNTLEEKLEKLYDNRAKLVMDVIDEGLVDNKLLKQGYKITPTFVYEGR